MKEFRVLLECLTEEAWLRITVKADNREQAWDEAKKKGNSISGGNGIVWQPIEIEEI